MHGPIPISVTATNQAEFSEHTSDETVGAFVHLPAGARREQLVEEVPQERNVLRTVQVRRLWLHHGEALAVLRQY